MEPIKNSDSDTPPTAINSDNSTRKIDFEALTIAIEAIEADVDEINDYFQGSSQI
ncbi:MAG: hypothetical protein M0019_04325 [Actinomycetota bacterium]|nr:hypothetical protein [Actinomycetota bacterium]